MIGKVQLEVNQLILQLTLKTMILFMGEVMEAI
jgi:hypothetical protein